MIRCFVLSALVAAAVQSANAYGDGLDRCTTTPSHGTSKDSGTQGLTLTMTGSGGSAVTEWTPGATYTVRLAGTTFKGAVAEPRLGSTRSGTRAVGSFSPKTTSLARASSGCANQVTHTSRSSKTAIEYTWTAPTTAGFGTVSFWATVVRSHGADWHEVSLVVQEGASQPSPDPSITPSPSASVSLSASPSVSASVSPSTSVSATPGTSSSVTPSATTTPTPSATPTSTPAASVTPSPSPSPISPRAAFVTLSLAASIDDAGASPASPARQTFVAAFRRDVSSALNITASRIVNVTVVAGSIRVSFAIVPQAAGTAGREADATSAVAELRRQVESPSSALRSGSGYAASVDASSGVTAVVSESVSTLDEAVRASQSLRDPSSFDHTAVLGPSASDGVTMRWSIVGGGATWRAQFEWAADSWASVGVKRDLQGSGMVDAWGVLFLPSSPDSSGRVMEIDLHNTTLGGVVPQGSQDLSVTRLQRVSSGSSSRRRVRAVRELAAGTLVWRADVERAMRSSDPRDPALTASTESRFVYALGSAPGEGRGREWMQYHGTRRGSYLVNLGTGAVSDAPLDPMVVAHGVLMFAAWGVLLPLGALLGRFAKNVVPVSGPSAFWFRWHWTLQLGGTASSLAGAATAVAMVAQRGTAHFMGLHKAGGLVVVLLGAGLAVAGMTRPGKDASWRWAWSLGHRGGGALALMLGAVTVVTGLVTAVAAGWVIGLAAGVLVCEVLVFAYLTVRGVGRKPSKPGASCQTPAKAGSGVIKPTDSASAGSAPHGRTEVASKQTEFVSPISKASQSRT